MTDKIKAVRLMCDFCATGVWPAQIPNSTMEGFRVSEGLWNRIQAWQCWHDSQDAAQYPDPAFDLEGFVKEGYAIAFAVKAERPDWVVIYVDEALLQHAIETGDKTIPWKIEIKVPI